MKVGPGRFMDYTLDVSNPKHPNRIRVEELLDGNVRVDVRPDLFLFRKPNSGDCLMRYQLIDYRLKGYVADEPPAYRSLVVTGDLGAAVYEFNTDLSFQWLAGLGFEYFASKCTASEHGRGYRTWCPRTAAALLPTVRQHLDESQYAKYDKMLVECGVGPNSEHLFSQGDWDRFCERELLGTFFRDMEGIHDIGQTRSLRCIAHLRGIQKSFLK